MGRPIPTQSHIGTPSAQQVQVENLRNVQNHANELANQLLDAEKNSVQSLERLTAEQVAVPENPTRLQLLHALRAEKIRCWGISNQAEKFSKLFRDVDARIDEMTRTAQAMPLREQDLLASDEDLDAPQQQQAAV